MITAPSSHLDGFTNVGKSTVLLDGSSGTEPPRQPTPRVRTGCEDIARPRIGDGVRHRENQCRAPVVRITDRSITLRSSRVFPSHGYRSSAGPIDRLESASIRTALLGELVDELPREDWDVVPLPKRRQDDEEDVRGGDMREVFAERARTMALSRFRIGGRVRYGHRPRWTRASEPFDHPALEDAQQFDLHLRRQLSDLVEKERGPGWQPRSVHISAWSRPYTRLAHDQ